MARRLSDIFGTLLGSGGRTSASPTEMAGAPGTAIYGGYLVTDEKNPRLASQEDRYRTYADVMANTSIVAAGMRYFLALIAKSSWSFTASEADTDGRFAELTEKSLTDDPDTNWPRIVRRAAMFRFYGFSTQEWAMKRHEDGHFTFRDIAPRAQRTIEKWDTDVEGNVLGVVQLSPQTSQELYIPRSKMLYLVDDTLNDSPEGLGLLRHLVTPAHNLERYQQLEGYGYENDLRGVPIGRGPFTDLAQKVQAGTISQDQRRQIEAPLRKFMQNHIRSANLGILLDSMTYESKDEAGRASSAKQWDVELLKSNSQNVSFAEIAQAIERLDREMARILGVEQLMLGSGSGSFALSNDKTSAFYLMTDAVLTEIMNSVEDDLVKRLFELNGWPDDMRPEVGVEAIRFTEVEQIAKTLVDMSKAGAMLAPDDPVISEVRTLMGVSQPETIIVNPNNTGSVVVGNDEEIAATMEEAEEASTNDEDEGEENERTISSN